MAEPRLCRDLWRWRVAPGFNEVPSTELFGFNFSSAPRIAVGVRLAVRSSLFQVVGRGLPPLAMVVRANRERGKDFLTRERTQCSGDRMMVWRDLKDDLHCCRNKWKQRRSCCGWMGTRDATLTRLWSLRLIHRGPPARLKLNNPPLCVSLLRHRQLTSVSAVSSDARRCSAQSHDVS